MARSPFFLALASLVLAALAVGCSAPSTSDDGAVASSDVTAAETPDALRDAAVMTGDVVVGQRSTVGYAPTDYLASDHDGDLDTWERPYLAWKIDRRALEAAGAPTLAVNVSGDFPGVPDVLVVDADFHVLASTRAQAENGLDVANLIVPNEGGEKLVLVRDKLWVLPMSFDITVSP